MRPMPPSPPPEKEETRLPLHLDDVRFVAAVDRRRRGHGNIKLVRRERPVRLIQASVLIRGDSLAAPRLLVSAGGIVESAIEELV